MSGRPGCLGFLFGAKDKAGVSKGLPYRLRDNFLSDAELYFYRVLRAAVGDSFTICPKVNLHNLFSGIGPEENKNLRTRMAGKHIDFLLCHKMTIQPVLGLDLDDRPHESKNRRERDSLTDDLFLAANLPLGRVFAADSYDPVDLRRFVFEAAGVEEYGEEEKPDILLRPEAAPGAVMEDKPAESPAGVPEDEAADTGPAENLEDMPGNEAYPELDIRQWRGKLMQELAATVSSVSVPLCPLCNVEMVLCTSKRGIQYYRCANSPRCRQVRGLLE